MGITHKEVQFYCKSNKMIIGIFFMARRAIHTLLGSESVLIIMICSTGGSFDTPTQHYTSYSYSYSYSMMDLSKF